MYRAVIFDLYGTLLVYGDMAKAWTVWLADVTSALSELELHPDSRQLAARCDGFFLRPVAVIPGLAVYESRLHRLAVELGGSPDLPWCRETARKSMDGWQQHIHPDPEALPLLLALREKNMRCALLTNFDYPAHIHRILAQTGFSAYLHAVVISGEEGLKKPDPRLFALVRSRLGVASEQTLFIGDHPDQDIAGALQSGMGAVLIRRGEGMVQEHVDFHTRSIAVNHSTDRVPVVERLPQILDLLNK